MLITVLTIINISLAIVLVILVILQQGKGSDLGSAFGGGSSNSIFGAVGPSNFLGRLTTIIAAIFLISCLAKNSTYGLFSFKLKFFKIDFFVFNDHCCTKYLILYLILTWFGKKKCRLVKIIIGLAIMRSRCL